VGVCKHADAQQCASQRGCVPLSLLPSPSPGARLTRFVFGPAHARLAAYPSASPPLPFILSLSLCLPLNLPLIHFVLMRCNKEPPTKHAWLVLIDSWHVAAGGP